jgi:hypothetical protein
MKNADMKRHKMLDCTFLGSHVKISKQPRFEFARKLDGAWCVRLFAKDEIEINMPVSGSVGNERIEPIDNALTYLLMLHEQSRAYPADAKWHQQWLLLKTTN